MANLTPHFTVEEFTHSQTAARKGIHNHPGEDSWEWENMKRLALVLEEVRGVLGQKPVLISSGYRSAAVNREVGGSRNSAHLSGLAVDFTCPGFGTPLQVCKAIEPHMRKLGIDQLIHEYGTWCHLGLTEGQPRHQTLTIDNKGTRNGFS